MKRLIELYRRWRAGEEIVVDIELTPIQALMILAVIIALIVTIIRLLIH